jgi:hypothetical protein
VCDGRGCVGVVLVWAVVPRFLRRVVIWVVALAAVRSRRAMTSVLVRPGVSFHLASSDTWALCTSGAGHHRTGSRGSPSSVVPHQLQRPPYGWLRAAPGPPPACTTAPTRHAPPPGVPRPAAPSVHGDLPVATLVDVHEPPAARPPGCHDPAAAATRIAQRVQLREARHPPVVADRRGTGASSVGTPSLSARRAPRARIRRPPRAPAGCTARAPAWRSCRAPHVIVQPCPCGRPRAGPNGRRRRPGRPCA